MNKEQHELNEALGFIFFWIIFVLGLAFTIFLLVREIITNEQHLG